MKKNPINTPEKRAIVKQVVQQNPGVESRKLARLLHAQYPLLFRDAEAARNAVRTARGSFGKDARDKCQVFGRTPKPSEVLRLPDSVDIPSTPFVINPGRTLILCDMHFPHHDKRAIGAALKEVKGRRIDTVLIGGDMADFFSISRFLTDPTTKDLKHEMEIVSTFLKYLRQQFPKARIVWKLGNHEERWKHYLWTKAPELYNLPCTTIEHVTGAEKVGVEVVDDRLPVKIGHLTFLHGHELQQGAASPVNPARGLFIRMVETAAIGHQHRTSEHAESVGMGGGRFITCWSIGCLCNLSPMYARVNKWNHGFAMVESTADGQFRFHNKRILAGKVL